MSTELREIGTEIWVSDGPVLSYVGFRYPTRTVVIRVAKRQLFVWSPIKLTTILKHQVDALGSVHFLVSPNRLHHLFLSEWGSTYPEARLYASPGLREKRRDLNFDAELGDDPELGWAGEIDQVLVRGSPLTEVVFFHHVSRTAVFCDLIQNFPSDWFGGWRGILARLDGICAPNPGAPREWRMMFYNRCQARVALRRILSWPIERVLIAHGEPVLEESALFVRRAFSWLLG